MTSEQIDLRDDQGLLDGVLADTKSSSLDVVKEAAKVLGTTNNPVAVSRLIELSTHDHLDVRSWALFSLGSAIEVDSVAIRDGLLAGLSEPDAECRGEAILGLALRGDVRVLDALRADLHDGSVGLLPLRAAAELGHPDLVGRLTELAHSWEDDQDEHLRLARLGISSAETGLLVTKRWVEPDGQFTVEVDRSKPAPRRLLRTAGGDEEVDAVDERYWGLLDRGWCVDSRDDT